MTVSNVVLQCHQSSERFSLDVSEWSFAHLVIIVFDCDVARPVTLGENANKEWSGCVCQLASRIVRDMGSPDGDQLTESDLEISISVPEPYLHSVSQRFFQLSQQNNRASTRIVLEDHLDAPFGRLWHLARGRLIVKVGDPTHDRDTSWPWSDGANIDVLVVHIRGPFLLACI